MSKGRSQPAPESQTVVQTTLPDYARPYFERMMGRAEAATNQPYQLYGGPRIADFSQDQNAAFDMTRNAAGAGQDAQMAAQGLAGLAGGQLATGQGYQAGQFNPIFQAAGGRAPNGPGKGRPSGNPNLTAGSSSFSAPTVRDPMAQNLPGVSGADIRDPMGANLPSITPDQVGAQSVAGAANPIQSGQIGQVQTFNDSTAGQYMSPYLNRVLDAQRARMQTRFDEQTVARQGEAAKAGVFGGYRQGVQQEMAQRDFNEQVNQQEAAALQAAFENSQQQFERDRTAGLGARQFDIGSDLTAQRANQDTGLRAGISDQDAMLRADFANQQAGMSAQQSQMDAALRRLGFGLEADTQRSRINQAADQSSLDARMRQLGMGLEADTQSGQFLQGAERAADASRRAQDQFALSSFQANEGARQQQEQLSLARLREMLGAGTTLSNLGSAAQQTGLRGAQALQGIGSQQQQREQASLDLAYQDFENQNNYDRNMINFLSGILRGVPVSPSANTSQYSNPNPYSQALGLGISGLALNNMFGGSGG